MRSRNVPLLAVGAAAMVLTLVATGATPSQESVAVVRLQQEIANLKFRLDYETGRLQRSVDDMQRRLQLAESRSGRSAVSVPATAPRLSEDSAPERAPDADELSARRIVVSDAAGRPRAALAYSELFGPTLALMTPAGDVAAMLSAPPAGPRLELFDGAARVRAELALDGEQVRFRLFDARGEVIERFAGEGSR